MVVTTLQDVENKIPKEYHRHDCGPAVVATMLHDSEHKFSMVETMVATTLNIDCTVFF